MRRWTCIGCPVLLLAALFSACPISASRVCAPPCGLNQTCDSAIGLCSCAPSFTPCPANGGLDAGPATDASSLQSFACVETLDDGLNCGACGIVCPPGRACRTGQCACDLTTRNLCPDDAGLSYCSDPSSDALNCGRCGNPCALGQICANSACACGTDDAGLALEPCNGPDGGLFCADLTHDNDNCSACGNVCPPDEHCVLGGPEGGQCACLPPLHACDGACVSGPCFDGGLCECGEQELGCFSPGSPSCLCVDPNTNINFCGGCVVDDAGLDCATVPGADLAASEPGGLVCNNGKCACGYSGQGTICPDGCQNLDDDPHNCGGCSTSPDGQPYDCTRGPTTVCERGQCVCPNGGLLCGTDGGTPACSSADQDPDNCGGCGNVCSALAAGATCKFGLCGCNPTELGSAALCALPPGKGTQPTCSCDAFVDDNVDPLSCAEAVQFRRDVFPLFAQTLGKFGCAASGCHAGAAPRAGLAFDVDAGVAYNVLLGLSARTADAGPVPYCDGGGGMPITPAGQPSAECGCASLIVPGPGAASASTPDNTTQSYLYRVLVNRGVCGSGLAMPIDQDGGWTPLDSCSVQLVAQWIQQGATF